jgi:hypothetical protein
MAKAENAYVGEGDAGVIVDADEGRTPANAAAYNSAAAQWRRIEGNDVEAFVRNRPDVSRPCCYARGHCNERKMSQRGVAVLHFGCQNWFDVPVACTRGRR